jgi:ubiquinone biosynthesis protein UbiJ
MKWPDPAAVPTRVANRMLADQDWAKAQLTPFAGRTFALAVGPLVSAWRISEGGLLETAPVAGADLRLQIAPWSLPAFLAAPTRWNEFVREEGDAEFGGALKELARTLPWFVEETFAKALGPIAGQRVADAGRRLLAFPAYAAGRLADSAGSYARDEAGWLPRADDLRRLREDTAALDVRIDALAARLDALVPHVRLVR